MDTAEVYLRAIAGPESLDRAPALETLARANIELGDEPGARAALAGLRTLADLVRAQPMLAAARFAQGAVAHAFADPAAAPFAGLTRREAEILRLVARGSANQDIAADLVISVRTVERHIPNIYLKLGLEGPAARASATAAALRHGLV